MLPRRVLRQLLREPRSLHCPQQRVLSTFPIGSEPVSADRILPIINLLDDTEITGSGHEQVDLSQHKDLLRTLKHIPDKVLELKKKALIDSETYGTDAITAAERGGLFLRQLRMEEETHSDAVNTYTQSLKQLIGMGKSTNLRYIQRILLKWYEPLAREIDAEIKRIEKKEVGMDRTVYGPPLLLLPAEKLAVITLEEAVNCVLKSANSGVTLTYLARRIGDLVEAEVSIINLKKGKAGLRPWQKDLIRNAYQVPSFRKTRTMLSKLVEDDNWSNEIKVKVGAALILFLLETATTENNVKPGQSWIMMNTLSNVPF